MKPQIFQTVSRCLLNVSRVLKILICEKIVGLYRVLSIHAATLTTVAKDALCRLNVPLSKLRGQCYDGASSMCGA